jgi:hypothetical protein
MSVATAGREFHVFTVGWEVPLIRTLTVPIAQRTGIRFTHGLVGDARRVMAERRAHPDIAFVALSKAGHEPLPEPDHALLASLESPGVPTIRVMVQGDRVLRYRSDRESLGYATLLARHLRQRFEEYRPDVVLASFDSLHASLSLAVAKSLGIPWVALAFTVIPGDLTGFCRSVTPDTLVPLTRPVDDRLRRQAREVIANVRARRQQIVAYRPPESLRQRIQRLAGYGTNFMRRIVAANDIGFDRFTYPTAAERLGDIARRRINNVMLPRGRMLTAPRQGRFVFFPLQMAPESSIDTWAPTYQNQLALIEQLHLAIPADVEFVVKLHFSDKDNYTRRQLLELMKLPRLRIAHPQASSLAFLQQAELVVAIQGTASLEAALLGKTVLLFGASPYLEFPRTQRARRPDQLSEQIRSMLKLAPPREEEIEAAFATYISRYMPGRINDWSRPISADEIVPLADCFQSLRAYLEVDAHRAGWYDAPPFTSVSESRLS